MGKTRGPKPLPTAILKMRGSRRVKDRQNELVVKTGAPSCPSELSEAAKTEWRRIVPLLEGLGLVTQLDRAALSAYCQSWADYVSAVEQLNREGSVYMSGSLRKQHPGVLVAANALKAVLATAPEFGLTPSSRSRLKCDLSPKTAADPQDKFFPRVTGT